MLIILSSSKSFKILKNESCNGYTIPCFLDESLELVAELRKLSIDKISKILKVSPDLAQLNFERYKNWQLPFTPQKSNQAILSFYGDVFKSLKVDDFSSKDFDYAQENLRIISGLFGMLRPKDLIHPYRLEMGTNLPYNGIDNLYAFWRDKIINKLNTYFENNSDKTIVDLASHEYFNVIDEKKLKARIVHIEFKETSESGYKVVAIYSKKARGLMARYSIKNRIYNVEDFKKFDFENYRYNQNISTESIWVFTR